MNELRKSLGLDKTPLEQLADACAQLVYWQNYVPMDSNEQYHRHMRMRDLRAAIPALQVKGAAQLKSTEAES